MIRRMRGSGILVGCVVVTSGWAPLASQQPTPASSRIAVQASRVAGVVVVRAEYANGSVADGNGVVVGTKETVVTTSGFLGGAASISVIEASPDAPTAATLVTVDTVSGI